MAVLNSSGGFSVLGNIGGDLHQLGRSNGNTTIKDVLHEPGEATGIGDTKGNIADAIYDAGGVSIATETFLDSATTHLSGASDVPLRTTADNLVHDFHKYIETVTDITGLAYAAHGVTALGGTIGLGNLASGNNLLGHSLDLADGKTSLNGSLTAISKDLTNISTAAPGPITGLVKDLGSDSGSLSTGLTGPHGIVGGSGLDLGKLPGVLSTADGPLGPVSHLADSVSHVTDGVGSSSSGQSNLITDALKLPTEVLPDGGPTPSLTDAGHQVTTTAVAVGDLVQHVGSGDVSAMPDGIGHIVSALGSFGHSSGPAIGIPQTLDAVVHGGSALSGGHLPSDLPDAIHGAVGAIVADISHDVSAAGHGSDVLGGILSASNGGGAAGGLDLSHVGAVLDHAPVGDLLTSHADLDHLTNSVDLFGSIGHADLLHVADHV